MTLATSNWLQNDALFLQELQKGRRFELMLALQLLEQGLIVQAPTQINTDPKRDRSDYLQQHDLIVSPHWAARPRVLEVKSRDLKFTCPQDYPYESAYVDTLAGWKRKDPKPVEIVIVSQITGSAVVCPVSSQKVWRIQEFHDFQRQISDRAWTVPRDELKSFDELVRWLHG